MSSTKYIGMDVHTESISIAVRNSVGKVVMECVIETKASTILQFLDGLRGDLRVTFTGKQRLPGTSISLISKIRNSLHCATTAGVVLRRA
jgi:hypothetical protein